MMSYARLQCSVERKHIVLNDGAANRILFV